MQSGTPKTINIVPSDEVSGVGLDITDDDKLKKRAKRKIITNKMRNPFKDVKLEAVSSHIEAISKDEFVKVCEAVGTEPSFQYLGGKTTVRKIGIEIFL